MTIYNDDDLNNCKIAKKKFKVSNSSFLFIRFDDSIIRISKHPHTHTHMCALGICVK